MVKPGLAQGALCAEGALLTLTSEEEEWMKRRAVFDCEDEVQLRILTSLFYPYIV